MNDILTKLHDLRKARGQIEALMSDYPDDGELHSMGKAAVSEIGAWESQITQLKHETYEDEDARETMLAGQLRFLMDVIDRTGAPVTDGVMTRLADLKSSGKPGRRIFAVSPTGSCVQSILGPSSRVWITCECLEAALGCRSFL